MIVCYLYSDDDVILDGDIANENIESPITSPGSVQKGGPFRFEVSVDAIGKAHLSKHHLKYQSLNYFEAEANGTLVFYYKPEPIEVAYFTAGYNYVNLNWAQNPYFRQKDFCNLTLAVGGISKRFDKWLWRTQFLSNMNLDHMNLNMYLTWDLLLWGRYKYSENLSTHIGLYTWLGMKVNRFIPILGVDWRVNLKWKLNAVFPVNMSLVYHINDSWSLALAVRALSSRNRVGLHENVREGIYLYQSAGGEVNLRYKNEDWFPVEAHAHVGYNFGGKLKVSNRHYRHTKTFHVGVAPYAGGEISARF